MSNQISQGSPILSGSSNNSDSLLPYKRGCGSFVRVCFMLPSLRGHNRCVRRYHCVQTLLSVVVAPSTSNCTCMVDFLFYFILCTFLFHTYINMTIMELGIFVRFDRSDKIFSC